MFSRCYCVKLNQLRYQYVPLFLPALLPKQDFHKQTGSHWTAGHSLPILQQSVITEPIEFFPQTIIIIIIIMLAGMKKLPICSHIFTPLILQFYLVWVFFGSRKKNYLHSFVFSSSFCRYGKGLLFGLSICWYFCWAKDKSNVSKSCYIWW